MEKQKKSPESTKKNEFKLKLKSSPEQNKDLVSQQELQYLTRCTRFRLSTEYELSICNCKHIMRMTIGERHSVVNPQKWMCNICCTTESVWACLSCPNVACGRYIHEHALTHYLDTKHPLVIDVNELYVYCYECEEYVLNDNKSGDLKVLRETLQAIRYQNFTGTTRSGHTLRTATISADEDVQMRRRLQQQQLDRDDRNFTAIWHSRFVRQRKTFKHWLHYVRKKKESHSDNDSDSDLITRAKDYCKSPVQQKNSSTSTSFDFKKEDSTTFVQSKSISDHSATQITANCQIPCKEETCVTQSNDFSIIHQSPTHSCVSAASALPSSTFFVNTAAANLSPVNSLKSETMQVVSEHKPSVVDFARVNNADTEVVIIVGDSAAAAAAESKELVPDKDHSKTELSESDQVLLPPEIEDKDLKREPEISTSPFKKDEITSSLPNSDDFDFSDGDVPLAQLSAELVRRPKRVNAASRYKAIMNQLSPSLSANEPIKKRLRTYQKNNSFEDDFNQSKLPQRRSLRLVEANKKKAAKEKKKLKRQKKKSQKPALRRVRKRMKPARKLPSRTLPSRKSRMQTVSKSIYDSIPNRAVTSLIPGVTGLRNLGNTCYLNSIIQVLGHLQKFRRCLLAVRDLEIEDKLSAEKGSGAKLSFARRSTIEMYESQSSLSVTRRFLKMQAGLNGGHESGSPEKSEDSGSTYSPKRRFCSGSASTLSLCHELHDLYHVMWSGKWKLVSPYHFLSSVWQLIPSFRGYSQQDAQEFLCELLDKIVSELERKKHPSQVSRAERLASKISGVVHTVFEGRLHSKVRCLECRNVSSTYEPFWDLSLEFPTRYHSSTTNSWKNSHQGCSLIEMLEKFTEAERLDGGRVYNCSHCNNLHFLQSRDTRQRRLSVKKPSQKLSEAEKQIKVVDLPQVLRFHLKRFRWSGRNNREKITVPVNFPAELDMRSYCWIESAVEDSSAFIYDLSAVVIHHGRGFSAGHYTAYCWNDTGRFWVHCNDSNLELCSIDDVMAAQAYILFYSQRGLDPHPHLSTPPSTPDLSPPVTPDIIPTSTSDKVFDGCANG